MWVVEERGVDEAFGEEGKGGKVGRLAKGAVRVTNDGGAEVFNGVNDWVYEEEVASLPSSRFFSSLTIPLALEFADLLLPPLPLLLPPLNTPPLPLPQRNPRPNLLLPNLQLWLERRLGGMEVSC